VKKRVNICYPTSYKRLLVLKYGFEGGKNMKKIMVFVLVLFLSVMWLSGCGEDEKSKGCLTGYYDDFYGTWTTDGGTFTMGDTIIFYENRSCDFKWRHNSQPIFTGTWERKSTGTGDFTLVLTIGDSVTTYYYCFFDSYKTLRLRAENSEGYTYYGKQ